MAPTRSILITCDPGQTNHWQSRNGMGSDRIGEGVGVKIDESGHGYFPRCCCSSRLQPQPQRISRSIDVGFQYIRNNERAIGLFSGCLSVRRGIKIKGLLLIPVHQIRLLIKLILSIPVAVVWALMRKWLWAEAGCGA